MAYYESKESSGQKLTEEETTTKALAERTVTDDKAKEVYDAWQTSSPLEVHAKLSELAAIDPARAAELKTHFDDVAQQEATQTRLLAMDSTGMSKEDAEYTVNVNLSPTKKTAYNDGGLGYYGNIAYAGDQESSYNGYNAFLNPNQKIVPDGKRVVLEAFGFIPSPIGVLANGTLALSCHFSRNGPLVITLVPPEISMLPPQNKTIGPHETEG